MFKSIFLQFDMPTRTLVKKHCVKYLVVRLQNATRILTKRMYIIAQHSNKPINPVSKKPSRVTKPVPKPFKPPCNEQHDPMKTYDSVDELGNTDTLYYIGRYVKAGCLLVQECLPEAECKEDDTRAVVPSLQNEIPDDV